MRRVAEGKEQAHGNRLCVADVGQRRQVERLELAFWTETAAHAVTPLDRDEWRGMFVAEAIQVCTRLSTQMKELLEAVVRDERSAGTSSLEQRVRRNRRAVR